jgi:DNA-binding MarR family transcriptional regulator
MENIGTEEKEAIEEGLASCACLNLRKAARLVTRAYDEALKPGGLTPTQFSILAVLNLAGPVTISRLSEHLATERTTLTRNLKKLQERGLVKTASGEDQRTRKAFVTDKGKQAFKESVPLWEKAQRDIVEKLGPAQWETLLGGLRQTVNIFSDGGF